MLKIENIDIKAFYKSSFDKTKCDKVQHFKNLPVLSIVQATEGHYDFGIDTKEPVSINEGEFFIAPAYVDQNIIHHVNPQSGVMSARWVFMDVILNDIYSFDAIYNYPVFTDKQTTRQINDIFNELFSNDDIIENKISCYRLMKILLDISKEKKKLNTYVQAAISYIEINYQKKLSVSAIAQEIGISPSRLYALFNTYIGSSPIAYLNKLRLSKACLLLENTDQSICGIAESCGIYDVFYFSKIFKKEYHISPKEYRKSIK